MNAEAKRENILTLQSLLGLKEEAAEKITGSAVLISGVEQQPILCEYIQTILGKTVESVHSQFVDDVQYSCEIIVVGANRQTNLPFVFVGQTGETFLVSTLNEPVSELGSYPHFFYFLLSCYISALAVKTLTKNGLMVTVKDEIIIDPQKIVPDFNIFETPVDIGEAYLAGAGAIGNSFIQALSLFNVNGKLVIADPDTVSKGNLNRCYFFTEDDVSKKKVDILVNRTQVLFPNLKLIAHRDVLNTVPANNGGAWLEKLIVAVDSRRARRSLQGEIPKEVFDASTTGISEVVLHNHKRPLVGACLGCIYHKEEQEGAHEKHIAELLGVSVHQVQQLFINNVAASLIVERYSNLQTNDLIGLSYDTLFKQLCGEGKLRTAEDKQVLAPLAFVSALAGAFLALNMVQRLAGTKSYNYWRISPWTNPNFSAQRNRPTHPKCDYCNSESYTKVASSLWPE